MKKIHFIGIGGIGMSALAQLQAMGGDEVSGSDRLLSKGHGDAPVFTALKKLGVKVYKQDGSGVHKDLDFIVVSSAIEEDNAELIRAKELGIKLVHRSQLLDENVRNSRTVAISGTSGKSTVSAMIFEILTEAGMSPSLITGASLLSLKEKGLYGNVFKGESDILIIEADESDGSLVNYKPEVGVCLNIQKDHKELNVLKEYFRIFAANCKYFIANCEDENIPGLFSPSKTFGLTCGDVRAENVVCDGYGSSFSAAGADFKINVPGKYNVYNALAAISVAAQMNVPMDAAVRALANFKGVFRRFNSVGSVNNIEVIDDFAHNPHKISAAISAAQLRGKRVLAFFQPHAFASVKLLTKEFSEAIAGALRAQDLFWLTEAYYPGGTIPEGVTAENIYKAVKEKGAENIFYNACREKIAKQISAEAKEGDVVIVMGARDPSLTDFAKKILSEISAKHNQPACEECLVNTCCMNYKK